MELSEELQEVREKWRVEGFLIPDNYDQKRFKFTVLGRLVLIGISISQSGLWDDFTAKGHILTSGITFRKVRRFEDDGEISVIRQMILGKLAISLISAKVSK